MPPVDTAVLVLVPVALVAGFIRGFAGFGGPMMMMPIMNQFLAPASTMWVMMWVDLFINVRMLPECRPNASRAVLTPLGIGTALTLPLGVLLLANTDPSIMKRVVGGAVLVSALVLLSGWRYSGKAGNGLWVGAGMLSGLIMGATALAVSVALFLSADRQTAAQVRANFMFWVFGASVLLLVLLVAMGALAPGHLGLIAVLTPVYFLGSFAGASAQGRFPDHIVRRAVLLLAAIVGAVAMLA